MKTLLDEHWHHLPENEIVELLETSTIQGLDTFEIRHRQEQFGPNLITPKKGKSSLVIFLLQFHQPLIYILLASAIITSFLQEWVDAGVIYGVVLVNAIIGFLQEIKAVKAIDALSRIVTSSATVLRSGERRQIPAAELVPGDIVFLQSGDKVPADLRLISCRELQVNESALTGESLPSLKKTATLAHDTQLGDRCNMAYSSTLVTYGVASGIVVATGDQTEIGRINEMIASADILATPLTKKLTRFSNVLLYVILALSAVTFFVGILRGEGWLEMFMAVVALAVGAIPEGLPAAVTITLAIGVAKMAKQNAIIRKLPAVETLGSTTIICSDKTGTLTQNQMTVLEIAAGGELYQLSGGGYTPVGFFSRNNETINPAEQPALEECLQAGALCNDATLGKVNGEWQIEGDPTEGALLVAARKSGITSSEITVINPRIDAIPFESQHQYMATMHNDNNQTLIYMKGSTESVLERCSWMLSPNGTSQPMDHHFWQRQAEEMAERGLRVLAFARLRPKNNIEHLDHEDIASGMVFLGLQGMIDPPRPEAVAAVRACQAAGIQVKMITGDHAVTAASIAGQIGLNSGSEAMVLTGRDLAALSDSDLLEMAEKTAVFARVAPEQKLRLVEALQARGHVVAMTGDGVNDAPALRQADIGVAMGVGGTEVAREAADMLLTDDNFSTIEAAVEEGRGVYDNLVKFITWTLPTNLGEGLVIMVAVFAGTQLPILPVQILWINMTTAVLLGLMLAFEPKEPGIMSRPPMDPRQPLMTHEVKIRIILVGFLLLLGSFGLFEWQLRQGSSLAVARTCASNVFVFGELFYLFNCRSLKLSIFKIGLFSNRWLLWGVGIMVGLQLLFTYLPIMHIAFGTSSIGLQEWIPIIGASFMVYIIIEMEKWIRKRHKSK